MKLSISGDCEYKPSAHCAAKPMQVSLLCQSSRKCKSWMTVQD